MTPVDRPLELLRLQRAFFCHIGRQVYHPAGIAPFIIIPCDDLGHIFL